MRNVLSRWSRGKASDYCLFTRIAFVAASVIRMISKAAININWKVYRHLPHSECCLAV
jgi:hypothetical protein